MQLQAHRALFSFDILVHIFECIAPEGAVFSVEKHKARHVLAQFTRVCKAFSHPAVNVLWREMNSIIPLLLLLGLCEKLRQYPNTHTGLEEMDLQGEISAVEWSRFQYYSRNIRSLWYDELRVGRQILPYLSKFGGDKPLFPSLRWLTWEPSMPIGTEVSLLFSRTLLTFSISPAVMVTATGTHSEHDSAFRSLLRQLRTHAPFLQKIAINFPFDPSCLIPLSSFKSIHEVDVVGANISLLRALSVMESLTTLTIDLDVNQLNREDIVSPCYGFSSLQNLTMCGSLLCAMDILAAMSPPRLESLAMCTIRPVTVDQCRAFLELLPVRLPQLHEVNFEAPILQAFDIDVELERRIMELVEPLLDLQGLERVDIEVKPEFALSLSDGDFLAMGGAWPCLRALRLDFTCEADTALPTVPTLVAFVRLCADLEELSFPRLELSPEPLPPLTLDTMVPFPLRILQFHAAHYQRVPNALDLAEYLDGAFPNLDLSSSMQATDCTYWGLPHDETWSRVFELLGELQSTAQRRNGSVSVM